MQLQSPYLSSVYLGSFFLTSCLVMGGFAAFYGSFSKWLAGGGDGSTNRVFIVEVGSASLSIFVGLIWIILLSVGKLRDIFPWQQAHIFLSSSLYFYNLGYLINVIAISCRIRSSRVSSSFATTISCASIHPWNWNCQSYTSSTRHTSCNLTNHTRRWHPLEPNRTRSC